VVVATLGGAIALAAMNSSGGRSGELPPVAATTEPASSVSAGTPGPPLVEPVIAPPEQTLIARRKWSTQVTIPDPGVPLRSLDLRIFANGRQVMREPLRGSLVVDVRDIPLARGRNEVSAALSSELGVGRRSQPVVIMVDDQAPKLTLRAPKASSVVNGTIVTVRGMSEPDAQVVVENDSHGWTGRVTLREDGAYHADLNLGIGRNTIVVTASDALGNRQTRAVTVTRGDPADNVRLTLTPRRISIDELPVSLTIRLAVTDANDRPVDGVPVTFSLSPPGQATRTYETTLRDGAASWPEVQIPRQGAVADDGFVTVRLTLPNGEVVSKSAPLPFE
jgi:hypothetical protein